MQGSPDSQDQDAIRTWSGWTPGCNRLPLADGLDS